MLEFLCVCCTLKQVQRVLCRGCQKVLKYSLKWTPRLHGRLYFQFVCQPTPGGTPSPSRKPIKPSFWRGVTLWLVPGPFPEGTPSWPGQGARTEIPRAKSGWDICCQVRIGYPLGKVSMGYPSQVRMGYPQPELRYPPGQDWGTFWPGQDGVPTWPGQDGVPPARTGVFSPQPGQDGVPYPQARTGLPPQDRLCLDRLCCGQYASCGFLQEEILSTLATSKYTEVSFLNKVWDSLLLVLKGVTKLHVSHRPQEMCDMLENNPKFLYWGVLLTATYQLQYCFY